jgi:isopenicillin-N N-acyltransferase-like protein
VTPVVLTGGPFERGQAQGAALRPLIQSHMAAWLGALGLSGVGEPRAYVAQMLAATDFATAIEAHTPDLMDEVKGVAAGADVPLELLFGLQLLDEEWAHRVRMQAAAGKLEKCSSVGIVAADGQTWVGQTMDLGAYTDGHQALLSIAGEGERPDALVFTVAGMIGLMGVNAAGVAVCVNSLPQLPSAPEGLPVAFVLRRLLQAASAEEACELVLSLPHATNQHYLIGGPGTVRAFEASCEAVREFHPPQAGRVLHTNHPLAEEKGVPEDAAYRANTVARLDALTARLSGGALGLDEIKAALSSCDDPQHPISRLRGESPLSAFTTGSMISALAPGRVESWVSAGPPSVAGYTAFTVADA